MVLKLVTASFQAVLVLAVGWLVASWLTGVSRFSLEKTKLDPLVRNLLVSLVRPIVIVVAAIAAIDRFGVDLTAVVAILGAGAIAVGLALKDSLGNIAAGALLLTLRPFHEGDVVDAGGETGTVTGLGLFVTSLKTPQGVLVTVPNGQVAGAAVRNYTRNGVCRADLPFWIAADADPEKARKALLDAITADGRVLEDPAPAVHLTRSAPYGAELTALAWVRVADLAEARSELTIAGRVALKKAKALLVVDSPVLTDASAS